jgi:hypothetical protein
MFQSLPKASERSHHFNTLVSSSFQKSQTRPKINGYALSVNHCFGGGGIALPLTMPVFNLVFEPHLRLMTTCLISLNFACLQFLFLCVVSADMTGLSFL